VLPVESDDACCAIEVPRVLSHKQDVALSRAERRDDQKCGREELCDVIHSA